MIQSSGVERVSEFTGATWAEQDHGFQTEFQIAARAQFGTKAMDHFASGSALTSVVYDVTIPVAIAVGRLLSRYLDDQTDALFWIVVWGYAIAMFAAAVVGHRRSRGGIS